MNITRATIFLGPASARQGLLEPIHGTSGAEALGYVLFAIDPRFLRHCMLNFDTARVANLASTF
jgi:hypothetical protein